METGVDRRIIFTPILKKRMKKWCRFMWLSMRNFVDMIMNFHLP